MKSSSKILIGVIILISFLVGFFIGMTVNSSKTDNSELAGTIGRINNSSNGLPESNKEIRTDLLTNTALLKSYLSFYNFHYNSNTKFCENIDFAIKAAENETAFREDYSMEIENLKKYREAIDKARKDLQLAVISLQKIQETEGNKLSEFVNNANVSISQLKNNEKELTAFVESLEKFLNANNSYLYTDLIKAHDNLSLNQFARQ